MVRVWPPRRRKPGVSVRPRALTLGVYLDALIAAGVDDGEPWDALAAPADACLAVLNALCEHVSLPEGVDVGTVLRVQAAEAWGRAVRERERGMAAAYTLRLQAEEAVGEGLLPGPRPGRLKLLRVISTLPPTERAAALAEPLARALVLGEVGAIQRQADEANRKAAESAARLN